MEKINKEELKKIQLDILEYIDKVCKENDIEYFINYGTLLGAVRHKGYIPWDDDIDISLHRNEYNKLMDILQKNENGRYKVLNIENSDWYHNNFAVLLDTTTTIPDYYKKKRQDTSIFVDIFPIDRFDNIKFIKKINRLNFLKRLSLYKKEHILNNDSKLKDLIRVLLWYGCYFISPKYFSYKIEKLTKKYVSKDGKFEGFTGLGDMKDVMEFGVTKELIALKFEHLIVKAPKNYNIILKNLYGDYMKLPPENERVNHEFEAYYLNVIDKK